MANKTWLLYRYEDGEFLCQPFDPKEKGARKLYREILHRNNESYYDTEAFTVSINKNGQMTAHVVWLPELDGKR